jgi:hypothetical protein
LTVVVAVGIVVVIGDPFQVVSVIELVGFDTLVVVAAVVVVVVDGGM